MYLRKKEAERTSAFLAKKTLFKKEFLMVLFSEICSGKICKQCAEFHKVSAKILS